MTNWSKKIPSQTSAASNFSLAPDWYRDAKKNGASESELFALVRAFCVRVLVDEDGANTVDDAFVQLMISNYEA
jgi:hypothetical protein